MNNIVSNEQARIQCPQQAVRSTPSAYLTLASHPTLRRTLLPEGTLG